MKHYILLLEDDDSLNRGISLKLTKEGYIVYRASTISEAKKVFENNQIELIICDIGLPDGNGLDFCSWIRKRSQVLFLFLTALDTELDIVSGYDTGADDYITKPFSLSILIAKVNALMKRTSCKKSDIVICSRDILLYPNQKRAEKREENINLTVNEWNLLSFFMHNPGHILSKQQLLMEIWGYDSDYMDDNAIAVNIRRLREKIEDNPSEPVYIKNVRGLGYVWEECTFEKQL